MNKVVPVFLLAAFLAGCAHNSPAVWSYKLYPGPTRPAAELAILRLDANFALRVDGYMVAGTDWNEVLLLPGRHEVDCIVTYGASVMVEAGGIGQASAHLEADLAAGHAYVIRYKRTYGQGYQVWGWIEDVADGSVVTGRKMP